MKRLPTLIALLMLVVAAPQAKVLFTITDGIADGALKQKAEANITLLLNEMQQAYEQNRTLRLTRTAMTSQARQMTTDLWGVYRIMPEDPHVMVKCVQGTHGYNIHNIAVRLQPLATDFSGNREREMNISFGPTGQITSVRLAMETHSFRRVLKSGDAVDLSRREEIMKWVEEFRSYYDTKDLKALNRIFDEHALIITGTVVKKMDYSGDSPRMRESIVYRTQNKLQYLNNLQKAFRANEFVKVEFETVSPGVVRDRRNPNFYGVTLHQKWRSTHYSDEGYVFLLWEFPDNGSDPVIHVRTWQPNMFEGKPLHKDSIINIDDFEIQAKKK